MVTAGELLAEAALVEGKDFQSFPEFSAERSGAPVAAFTRISPSPIDIQSAVVEPDIVMVLDPTLLGMVNVFAGLKPGTGIAVINSTDSPDKIQMSGSLSSCVVCTLDATGIAQELLGRNLPNIPMLGALIRATELVSLETMTGCIERRLTNRISAADVEANKIALQQGFDRVRITKPLQDRTDDYPDTGTSPTISSDGWRGLPIGGYSVEAGSSVKTNTGAWRANTPTLDLDKCTHCMLCWLFCPDDSVIVDGEKVQGFDLLHCKGCGICAEECPRDAITMGEQT